VSVDRAAPPAEESTEERFERMVGTTSRVRVTRSLRDAYDALSLPLLVGWLFDLEKIDPAYKMTRWKLLRLAWRMYRNTRALRAGVSYRAHLAMAAKLLETPKATKGAIVECGCWLGGSTVNLSLVADIVGRDLIVYDSFEGLPRGEEHDRNARPDFEGFFRGDVDVVRRNVERYGVGERVTLRKGWFDTTLPDHREPVVLCFLDVDYQASLHDCIVNLWPHLTPRGYVFIDEYMLIDYCALFFSERFWKENFDAAPPGLIGSGAGVGVGQYYLGPFNWRIDPTSIAFTRKDFYGRWDYEPAAPADEEPV
jgi:hypothetical protein